MFVDEVKIKLIAGKGGDGCTSFRREKFIAMGGPNGGNGGKGASIIFKTDKSLKTLIDLKVKKIIKGDKGVNGKGDDRNGANAEDVIIKVPEGTVVTDLSTGNVICDLIDGEFVVAKGGRGGRGNRAFATHDNPAPKMSELGAPGEELEVKCELKVLADVGLVGLPSVGKSTLLSVISNATPKIAAYHFTTLSPNLGVVTTKDNSFVIADLPGLIEGASLGVGLGHKFLKHIERTKIIAHVIDMSGSEGRNPYEDYMAIRKELASFSEKLLNKKEIIIANKMDIDGSLDNLREFKSKVSEEVISISALNKDNLEELIDKLNVLVEETEDDVLYEDDIQESHVLYKFKKEKPYSITKEGHTYVISGKEVEKIFKMMNFNTEEAINRFSMKLRNMGVDDDLEKMGIQEGDIVKILDYEFEYTK